jgi:uncharacterized protein with PIN domain
MSDPSTPSVFACDAMLGSLARWLRAAGYDAVWEAGIDDWELLRRARQQGHYVLSSDTGIFRIGLVRDGDLPALFVPHGLTTEEQVAFVLAKLHLSLRPPRCMACGGALVEVPRDQVQDQVPPRSLAAADQFWRCERCARVFWRGTHWQRIDATLRKITAA